MSSGRKARIINRTHVVDAQRSGVASSRGPAPIETVEIWENLQRVHVHTRRVRARVNDPENFQLIRKRITINKSAHTYTMCVASYRVRLITTIRWGPWGAEGRGRKEKWAKICRCWSRRTRSRANADSRLQILPAPEEWCYFPPRLVISQSSLFNASSMYVYVYTSSSWYTV